MTALTPSDIINADTDELKANGAHIVATYPQTVLALIAADAAKAERIAELEARESAFKEIIDAACFHYFGCDDGSDDGCGQLRPTMAHLARAIGYDSNPVDQEEIAAVPPASSESVRRAAALLSDKGRAKP